MNDNTIYNAVLGGIASEVPAGVQSSMAQYVPAQEILQQGLIKAMEEVGKRYEEGEFCNGNSPYS